MEVKCIYCGHREPGDLVREVDQDWQHVAWKCEADGWCSLRTVIMVTRPVAA